MGIFSKKYCLDPEAAFAEGINSLKTNRSPHEIWIKFSDGNKIVLTKDLVSYPKKLNINLDEPLYTKTLSYDPKEGRYIFNDIDKIKINDFVKPGDKVKFYYQYLNGRRGAFTRDLCPKTSFGKRKVSALKQVNNEIKFLSKLK